MSTPRKSKLPVFERREKEGFFLDGRRLIGVTRALAAFGVYDGYPKEGRDWYLHRGRAIGMAGAQLAQEVIDGRRHFNRAYLESAPYVRGETPEQIEARMSYAPHIRCFMRWLDVSGFKPKMIELPLYHAGLLYVGIPDMVGEIPGISQPYAIDLKINRAEASCGYQLAAYCYALESSQRLYRYKKAFAPHIRLGIGLPERGEAKVEEFRSPDDLTMFWSALNNARYRGLPK